MVTFDLTKNLKQQQYFNAVFSSVIGKDLYRKFGYGGAIRGGKTSVVLNILYLLCRKFAESRWYIVRDSFTNLQDTTIPSFEKFFPENKTSFIKKYNRAKDNFHVEFINGSKLFFKSENITQDPLLAWMDGLECNGIFLEQIDSLDEKTWNKSIERIGSWYIEPMPPPMLFYTTNPAMGWVKANIYSRWKQGILEKDHLFVEALPNDNPFVTNDQWEGWKSMDTISYNQRIKGDWDAFAKVNAFAYAFSEARHVAEVEREITEPIYLSFDFNHAPCTCTIWQHYGDKIRCLDEVMSFNGLVDLCRQLRDKFDMKNEILYVTGDKSGWNRSELLDGNRTAYDIIQNELGLTAYQVQAPDMNPNHLKSRELVNSIFEKHRDVKISPKCVNLIYDLKFVSCDDKHQIIKDRNKAEGKADLLDTLRYYLNTYHKEFIHL